LSYGAIKPDSSLTLESGTAPCTCACLSCGPFDSREWVGRPQRVNAMRYGKA